MGIDHEDDLIIFGRRLLYIRPRHNDLESIALDISNDKNAFESQS